jgi:hypothetical protein
MYVYMCMCVYECVYVCMCACVYVCMSMYVCMHVCCRPFQVLLPHKKRDVPVFPLQTLWMDQANEKPGAGLRARVTLQARHNIVHI